MISPCRPWLVDELIQPDNRFKKLWIKCLVVVCGILLQTNVLPCTLPPPSPNGSLCPTPSLGSSTYCQWIPSAILFYLFFSPANGFLLSPSFLLKFQHKLPLHPAHHLSAPYSHLYLILSQRRLPPPYSLTCSQFSRSSLCLPSPQPSASPTWLHLPIIPHLSSVYLSPTFPISPLLLFFVLATFPLHC